MAFINNKIKKIVLTILFICAFNINAEAQMRRAQNLPFADQKMYHLGFLLGLHTQDMPITNSGVQASNGETWFSEIPSYSMGFNVGMLVDRYVNEHFNLRLSPTMYFGEKKFVFREQSSGEELEAALRSNYFTIPLHLKFSATRSKNFRPYILAGPYLGIDISGKKNEVLRFKSMDYGLEFGLGCNIYFPIFKLCPEIKFSLGLADIINKDRSDLSDPDLLKYSNAISSGKNRMISLIFNFE